MATESITLEKVWELFRENDRRAAERQAEYDRKRELEKAEYDKRWAESEKRWAETKETWDKADRRITESNRKLGGIEKTFGDLVEHLVAPGVEDRFRELGFEFKLTGESIRLKDGRTCLSEIDLFLENDDRVMAVEVKAKPRIDDIEEHTDRLAKLRAYYSGRGDRRQIHGAIAGAVFGEGEKKAALKAGFYVIVQSGDTMRMDIPEGFVPGVW